jgi:hypothetical protein
MSIIFYGAGKYAADNIERLKGEGIVPVCFADADESKQGTQICGYDVLSLENAILEYPDYVLYITLDRWNLKDATEFLLGKGIPLDKIRYCEPVEYRNGCVEVRFTLAGSSLGLCHFQDLTPWVDSSGDYSSDVIVWRKMWMELYDSLRNNRSTFCDKCEFLKYDVYESSPIVNEKLISFIAGNQQDFA